MNSAIVRAGGGGMSQIYSMSLACMFANWRWYVGVCVMLTIIPIVMRDNMSLIASAPLNAAVLFLMRRYFLFGERIGSVPSRSQPKIRPYRIRRFLLVVTCMLLATTALAAAVTYTLFGLPSARNLGLFVSAGMFWEWLIYLLILSFFGTMLPASLDAGPTGYTVARAAKLGPVTMIQLLCIPGLFAALMLVGRDIALTRVHTDAYYVFVNTCQWIGWAPGFAEILLSQLLVMFPTTLATAILCDTYRRIVPKPAHP